MTLLLLLLLIALPGPGPADTRFAEGNTRFDAGDYAGARAAYLDLISDGHASAGLYFNLADTYYRLDSLGRAIQYLEKARRLTPDDPRVAHNLTFIGARLDLNRPAAPPPYWQSGLSWLHRSVSPALLFGVGWGLFLAALGLAGRRAWTGRPDPWVRRGLLVLLPPAGLLIGLAFVVSLNVGVAVQGVVLEQSPVQVEAGAVARTIPEGSVVRVLAAEPERVEIETADGVRGWMAAARLGTI